MIGSFTGALRPPRPRKCQWLLVFAALLGAGMAPPPPNPADTAPAEPARLAAGDPAYLLKRADEELVKGNSYAAIGFLYRAAKNSTVDADRAWQRYADVCFEHSAGQPILYLSAIDGWALAVKANPSCLPAHEKRVGELYTMVRAMTRPPLGYPMQPFPGNVTVFERLKALRAAATDEIAADPRNARAYACRGYTVLMPLARLPDTEKDAPYIQGQADLAKAMELAPDDFSAYLFQAEFEFDRARQLFRVLKDGDDARKLQDHALGILAGYLDKHPKDLDAAAEWGERCAQLGRTDDVLTRLTPLYDPNAPDRRVAHVLALELLRQSKFKEAEEILKKTADANPADPLALFRLAQHYDQFQKFPEAVACWRTLHSPKPANLATGFPAFAGAYFRGVARQELPRVLLQAALGEGLKTPAAKEHLEEAGALIDTLRGLAPNDPYVALLQGRLLFQQSLILPAIRTLKQADEIFSTEQAKRGPAGMRNFILCKTYMAEAYRANNDLGLALKCYDQILAEYPTDLRTTVERAKIYVILHRSEEAVRDLREVLRRAPDYPGAKLVLVKALTQIDDSTAVKPDN